MEASQKTIELVHSEPIYEQCEQCGAPLDKAQRYCVMCGNHRRHIRDPAARHLARGATASRTVRGHSTATPRRRTSSLLTAVIIAAIPLAIGLGVLVGRASTNGDDKLIAALRAQQPQVLPGGSAATSSSAALTSSFPLQSGYAVELQTLAGSGATQATVATAEAAAKAKGASGVGLIAQSEFKVTPAPPAGAYVLYAGAFKTRAAASKELKMLVQKFPKAIVIQVQPLPTAGAGQVLARTPYGVAHQVTGFHATQAQLAQGGQVVQQIQKTYGKNYVQSQRGLPDQISVP
jgi:hypothetical protein